MVVYYFLSDSRSNKISTKKQSINPYGTKTSHIIYVKADSCPS